MKKLYFLITFFITCLAFSQGNETFDNFPSTNSSYVNGTFVGQDGSTWSHTQCRGDVQITDQSIMIGRNRTPQSEFNSGTITGGLGTISFDYMQAFGTNVNLNVEVNGSVVGNVTSTSEANMVKNSPVFTVNQPGNIVIRFINVNNSDGQVVIDNVVWTNFATSCGVTLGTATYTCNSNTVGDNNDSVTVNVPYTGSDMGITSVTTTSTGTIGGDAPALTADGTITITGLSEGDAWDVVLNGGDCDTFNVSGTVPAAECDPIPNTCFDLSNGMNNFELVTVTPNSQSDEWTLNTGTYSMNGFCGGGCTDPIETWMIFGPLDMAGVTDLALSFDATESFGVTDLVFAYTDSYSGCPSTTSWTTAQTITDAGSYDVDLSMATGTDVFIGVQYLDDGTGGFSGWNLSNVSLDAFGSCPTLGMVPVSSCAVCDIVLQTETYTCNTNTAGDDNDEVIINIPYTGTDNTITSVTTTAMAIIGGDDPATIADGTITLSGLSEGDAWDITINGGDCDGTTLSGTVASAQCDPTFLIINEIHADPDAANGDANGDGAIDSSQDEFVEIYNTSSSPIVMDGYVLSDAVSDRHVFPVGTTLPGNSFITVFGGGTPTGFTSLVQTASTNSVGLNNGGDTVTLKDDTGLTVTQEIYTGAGNNQSIAREPDFTGVFVQHSAIMANPVLFSPGARNDGTTLSVDQFNATNFSVYPNPSNTGFVNITTTTNAPVNVVVFDILGKEVISKTIQNNTLNVSNLKAGIYILKLNQNEATITKKLVIE